MLIFFSAFKPRVPMNKAGINSSCHGESARVPALCLDGRLQTANALGGGGKDCKMTFFLVRGFLEAAFPVQQGGLLWLLHSGARAGFRGVACIVVKSLFFFFF